MRRSIATVCLSGNLREKIEAIAATRFDAVEIFENDLLFFEGLAPEVRNMTADHVAYALPAEQFGSWILFYRSVLGFVPDDLWELPDPHGIVRSRVVAAQDRSVCFALNISESRNTATGRSVSRFDGTGVHHIALATNNIFETAAKLVEHGVSLLHIPQNYYLDLETRFDLTPEELEKLRLGKILYDRSASGEFLHLYTDFIEDRFYFEIVERRGDYRGFGAINAPVRLAAQSEAYRRSLIETDESY